MEPSLEERFALLRAVVTDVDGCFTDGSVIFSDDGTETREFDIKDGMGVTLANQAGLITVLVSGMESETVARRARQLRFSECLQGYRDKRPAWRHLKQRYHLKDEEMAYLGDDLLDLCILGRAGCSFAPADAAPDVRRRVHVVLSSGGGRGAFREMVEMILKARGEWESLVAGYLEGPPERRMG